MSAKCVTTNSYMFIFYLLNRCEDLKIEYVLKVKIFLVKVN